MGDDVDVGAVAGDEGWRGEGEDGVFHAAIGEAGGKDEDVVGCPCVWVDEGFSSMEERFH